jgi:hypothetical protein
MRESLVVEKSVVTVQKHRNSLISMDLVHNARTQSSHYFVQNGADFSSLDLDDNGTPLVYNGVRLWQRLQPA